MMRTGQVKYRQIFLALIVFVGLLFLYSSLSTAGAPLEFEGTGDYLVDVESILEPVCEPVPGDVKQPVINKIDMNIDVSKVDYRNIESLKKFCHPYEYTRLNTKVSSV